MSTVTTSEPAPSDRNITLSPFTGIPPLHLSVYMSQPSLDHIFADAAYAYTPPVAVAAISVPSGFTNTIAPP